MAGIENTIMWNDFNRMLVAPALDLSTGVVNIPNDGFYLVSLNFIVNGTSNADVTGFEVLVTTDGVAKQTFPYSLR